MPFCVNCGSELRAGARFCSQCGARARIPSRVRPKTTSIEKKVTTLSLADITEIEDKIRHYETVLAEEPSIDLQIQKLSKDLAEIEKEVKRMVRMRFREELDVRELEGLSWKGIKARFRGDFQQLKEKEQREFLAALAKEKEVKQERWNILRQLERLKEEKRKIERAKQELPRLKRLLEQHHQQVKRTTVDAPKIIEERQVHQEIQLKRSLKQQEQEHLENVMEALKIADRHFTNVLQHLDKAEPHYQKRQSVEYVADLFAKEPLKSARKEILHAQQALRQASMELLAVREADTSGISIPDFKYQEVIDMMIDDALTGKGFSRTKQRMQQIQHDVQNALAVLSPTHEQVKTDLTKIETKEVQQRQRIEELAPTIAPTDAMPASDSQLESSEAPAMKTSIEGESTIIHPQSSITRPPSSGGEVLETLYQRLDEISYRFNKLDRGDKEIMTEFSTGAIEMARWSITSDGDLQITFTGKDIHKHFDIIMEKPTNDDLPPYDWLNPFAGIQITTSEEVLYRLKQETQLAENIRKIKQPLRIEVKTTPNISGQVIVKHFDLEDVDDVVQVIKDLGWSLELTL